MIRKKRQTKVGHDRWLVSYADFITLLFAFFVVLFATGQTDMRKKAELAVSIQTAFSQMGLFEAHSQAPAVADSLGRSNPLSTLQIPSPEQPMRLVRLHLLQVARPEIDSGVIALYDSPSGLVISLQEAGFFESGAVCIRTSALPVLHRIAEALPQSPMRVEGHTDNLPIHTAQFASNWELSSSRASSIARLLLGHPNIHADQMSVAGYAEFHPVASNGTPEGRARNRRVDIVLLNAGNQAYAPTSTPTQSSPAASR
jgi:chemotaxis protein MotB